MTTINGNPTVIRTSRGLTVAGTRTTLYTILDYLHADWPPKLIQQWLDLSDEQMADIQNYLACHSEEVEKEYQQVVEQAQTLRQYWNGQLEQHLAHRPVKPLTAEQSRLRAKFRAWKAQQPAT